MRDKHRVMTRKNKIYTLSRFSLFETEHRQQVSERMTWQREQEKTDKKEEEDGENYTINMFRIGIFNKNYRDD